jgi:hypothetical protein
MTSPLNMVQAWSFNSNISLRTSEQQDCHSTGQPVCESKRECGHNPILNSPVTHQEHHLHARPMKQWTIILHQKLKLQHCVLFMRRWKQVAVRWYLPYSYNIAVSELNSNFRTNSLLKNTHQSNVSNR